jgi:very-short-patch-repair endonuclease
LTILDNAKQLRIRQTEAEQRLWHHLRGGRFLGHKFKRQKPVGPYIADFVCLSEMLLVEVDGGQHNAEQAADSTRDRWFISRGFTVLRFWNHEVLQQTEAVLEKIRLTIEQQQPLSPAPLPHAGEGDEMS